MFLALLPFGTSGHCRDSMVSSSTRFSRDSFDDTFVHLFAMMARDDVFDSSTEPSIGSSGVVIIKSMILGQIIGKDIAVLNPFIEDSEHLLIAGTFVHVEQHGVPFSKELSELPSR